MNITKCYSSAAEMCEVVLLFALLGSLLVLSLVGEAPVWLRSNKLVSTLEAIPKSNTNIRCGDSQALRWSSSR